MKRIVIKDEFPEDHISRVAGERLRDMILEATSEGGEVEVDFSELIIASTSFFDEGFAKLTQFGWTKKRLLSRIKFKGINPKDWEVLEKMFKNRENG